MHGWAYLWVKKIVKKKHGLICYRTYLRWSTVIINIYKVTADNIRMFLVV